MKPSWSDICIDEKNYAPNHIFLLNKLSRKPFLKISKINFLALEKDVDMLVLKSF